MTKDVPANTESVPAADAESGFAAAVALALPFLLGFTVVLTEPGEHHLLVGLGCVVVALILSRVHCELIGPDLPRPLSFRRKR